MSMEQEIAILDEQMKEEIKNVKNKYSKLKAEVKKKYREIEKQKKKQEKEETKKIRKSIPKSLKILVWDKNIGKEKGIGECDVCKSEIDSKAFECGHIISVKEGGGTDIENLLPICSSCNKSMGTQNLHEFKEKYFKNQTAKKGKKVNETHIDKFIQQKLRKTTGTWHYPVVSGVECKQLGKIPKFLSLDSIYNTYRDWLNENYRSHYESTQYGSCTEGSSEKDELKDKLVEVYGEYTSDPNPSPVQRSNGFNSFGFNSSDRYNNFGSHNSDPMQGFLTKKGYGFVNISFS